VEIAFLLFVLATVLSAYAAQRMASARGRPPRTWLWLAVFFGPLVLPVMMLLPVRRSDI
jgi:hypothetical protein